MYAVIGTATARADHWPQWRGPEGNSVSRETGLPLHWSEQTGLAWKTPLPDWGTSTPAIWGEAVFVTTEHDGRLLLLKVDGCGGAIVWQREIARGTAHRKTQGADKRTSKFHELHNLASPSPVTDGKIVVAHFGSGDLAACDFDGKLLWKRNLVDDFGAYTIWWGHANSPVLHGDLVISVCMQDSLAGQQEPLAPSYVVAHRLGTGELAWKTMRMTAADAEECDAYTTPVFTQVGGRTQMIVMGGNQLDAYDPATGQQLWHLSGLVGGRTITGPTVGEGLAFATVGMRGPLHAVRLDGSGPLTGAAVAWKHADSTPDSCCPLVYRGLVFLVTDNGIASCLDAKTGALNWKERLAARNFKASPLGADGRVYFLGMDGKCTVVTAAQEFEILAENRLDNEFLASPAVSGGRIYLRGRTALYAIE